jgi:hypothetical protein
VLVLKELKEGKMEWEKKRGREVRNKRRKEENYKCKINGLFIRGSFLG